MKSGSLAGSERRVSTQTPKLGMRPAPRGGERTPLACRFRRRAENFVPLTFCAGRKIRTGTRWLRALPIPISEFVKNTRHEMRGVGGLPAFDTVRGFFVEGQLLFPTAGLRALAHVHLCVRRQNSFVGFFRPSAAR